MTDASGRTGSTDAIRVLGVDPGLTRCGLAVVAGPVGAPSAVATAVVRTDPTLPIERRLLAIETEVAALLDAHPVQMVACERVLFSRNVRTAMATAQAAGAAMVAAARVGIPVHTYSPTDVKSAVAGYGGADKQAVGRMVTAQLRLPGVPSPPDVADAMAVALTHLARHRVAAPVRGATAGWEAVLARPHVRQVGGA